MSSFISIAPVQAPAATEQASLVLGLTTALVGGFALLLAFAAAF